MYLPEKFILCLLSTVIGCLRRASDKITMKGTGTSKTTCFEKMIPAGVGLGEWIGWNGDWKRARHFLPGFVRVLENLESPGILLWDWKATRPGKFWKSVKLS